MDKNINLWTNAWDPAKITKMEDAGIDPATSRMLSARSTIWANPPLIVKQIVKKIFSNIWNLDFLKTVVNKVVSLQKKMKYTNDKIIWNAKKLITVIKVCWNGEWGHRSRYLAHAKRALYHLS